MYAVFQILREIFALKLKKVEILGFKSFADKTVIEFHEGITCVVGPNGCGKSNIGDAIRWVLGEQSAKALRGGKMPDVIFAGASTKKPLNLAEVTITFSDVQGALPLDYDEVAVTRRLYRNGDSEYLINKQLVRLKDVHSLFLDSGIGKNNISFFEQGKIDQLIQYSPEERRTIFEEAAGIVRFLQRKRETLRKLDEVGLNLSRVADIKGEIDKQILLLEEQAEKAKLYKVKKAELELFEKEHIALRFLGYAKKKGELTFKETEAKGKHQELNFKKEQLDVYLESKKQTHEELEKSYSTARDILLTKKSEKELKSQIQLHSDERVKELIASENKMANELKVLEAQRTNWVSEIVLLKEMKEKLYQKLKELNLEVAAKKLEFQTFEKDLQILSKKQTEAYREKVSAFQKHASLHSEAKQIVFRTESNLEKKEQFEGRSKNLLQMVQEKEQEVRVKNLEYTNAEFLVSESEKKFQEIESRLRNCFEDTRKAKASLEVVMKEFHEKSAKLKALIHLRQEFSGFTGGGKRLLQEAQTAKSPLFGLLKGLYEYIQPSPGYEKAVSAVLKNYSQTLVVKSKDALEAVLAFAKQHSISDFSLISLEHVPISTSSPFIHESKLGHYLLRFLSFETNHQNAFEKAFSNGEASWCAEGQYIDEKGVLFIGSAKESSIFIREAEIKSLENEILTLNQTKTLSELKVAEILKREGELQLEKTEADGARRKSGHTLTENRFALQKVQSDLERVHKEKNQVDEEIKSLLILIEGMLLQQQKILETVKTADTDLENIQKHLNEVELELASKVQLTSSKKTALQIEEKEQASLDASYRKTSHQYQLIDAKNAETERLINRLKEELGSGKKAILDWQQRLHSNATDLSCLAVGLEEAEKEEKRLEQERILSKKSIHLEEISFKDLEKQIREVENKMHQTGIQLSSVETGQNAVLIEMQERFQSEMIEPSLNKGEDWLVKEMQQLRVFIDQNQNVNLAAIEECAKQNERRSFLEEQMADLSSAKAELLKMIAGLDEESRHLFKTTFNEIRRNFQKNFQILFKGGEADLELLEADDILEAGIEITAKPPGKQMRSLSLLSGGEKCLTAMALLFAIFEVKASPFCVLDEIDAPLDDSNVERFLNVVKQFIDRCQFIIVTHNKRTMALADRLYGVSMEEKGISKLLFMEFSEKSTELVGV